MRPTINNDIRRPSTMINDAAPINGSSRVPPKGAHALPSLARELESSTSRMIHGKTRGYAPWLLRALTPGGSGASALWRKFERTCELLAHQGEQRYQRRRWVRIDNKRNFHGLDTSVTKPLVTFCFYNSHQYLYPLTKVSFDSRQISNLSEKFGIYTQ